MRSEGSREMMQAIAEARMWERDAFYCHHKVCLNGVGRNESERWMAFEEAAFFATIKAPDLEWDWELEEITFREELLLGDRGVDPSGRNSLAGNVPREGLLLANTN